MIRKLLLASMVLMFMLVPPAVLAEDRHDSHEHREPSERHDRSEHREPFGPPVYWPYPSTCSWQGGSWEYRGPFLGADGNYYYVPYWVVPPQWVCN